MWFYISATDIGYETPKSYFEVVNRPGLPAELKHAFISVARSVQLNKEKFVVLEGEEMRIKKEIHMQENYAHKSVSNTNKKTSFGGSFNAVPHLNAPQKGVSKVKKRLRHEKIQKKYKDGSDHENENNLEKNNAREKVYRLKMNKKTLQKPKRNNIKRDVWFYNVQHLNSAPFLSEDTEEDTKNVLYRLLKQTYNLKNTPQNHPTQHQRDPYGVFDTRTQLKAIKNFETHNGPSLNTSPNSKLTVAYTSHDKIDVTLNVLQSTPSYLIVAKRHPPFIKLSIRGKNEIIFNSQKNDFDTVNF